MIIQEHLYRPIKGKVLLIGAQNTDITPQAWINLLKLYDLTPDGFSDERPHGR
jgi:hypothetical protein